jgi:acylphosphatase
MGAMLPYNVRLEMTAVETHARLYLVSGRVQGVGFRFFVEREARTLRLKGYVRNLDDGRVEVYAIGDERSFRALRRKLESGPAGARVESVAEREAPRKDNYREFSIEAGGAPSP